MFSKRLAGFALAIALATGAAVATPTSAADKKMFEGVLRAPSGGASYTADLVCPDGGPGNGINYAWIDLGRGSKFTKFHLKAAHLVPIPDAAGINAGQNMGEHDLDLWIYDEKCKDLTQHTGNLNSTVKDTTKRPARYVLIDYYVGVSPNVPWTLEASV
jgi:hypothetical protein